MKFQLVGELSIAIQILQFSIHDMEGEDLFANVMKL